MHLWLCLLVVLLGPALAWSQTPDLTSALELHLTFDEGATTTAQDSTANNHDGTLGVGASWGPGKLGPFALVLDGSTSGSLVTVPGELTQPTSVTLAAWVKVAGFPVTDAEIVSIGGQVILRLTATNVQAYFYSTSGFIGIPVVAFAIGTTAWHHLAYTVTAGAQRLYIDGVLQSSGSSALVPYYAVRGTNTVIGSNGEGGTTPRLQGSVDDVRVYTRALSATDIAALVALEDPETLAVQIVTPTPDPTLSTTAAGISTLGGTASDGLGVTGVQVTCPTCTPASVLATCTPACGATTTSTTWTAPSLSFLPGTHTLTATATDGSGASRSDTLTVTATAGTVAPAPACTHWASPTGGGNGLAVGSPFQIVQFWALATPGTVLCLLPGTYTGNNSVLHPPSGLAGTSEAPITIQARSVAEEGTVILDGQFTLNPVALGATNQWFVITGLTAKHAVNVVYWFAGAQNIGRRLVGWNASSGQSNATVFTIIGSNTIIEDCAGWGENVRTIFQGSGTTSSPGSGYRRCFGEWNDHPTGGTLGGACAQPGKDQLFENVLCTVNKTGD